jgi:hypothetical protein
MFKCCHNTEENKLISLNRNTSCGVYSKISKSTEHEEPIFWRTGREKICTLHWANMTFTELPKQMCVLTENSIVLIESSIHNGSCIRYKCKTMPRPAFRIQLEWLHHTVQQTNECIQIHSVLIVN